MWVFCLHARWRLEEGSRVPATGATMWVLGTQAGSSRRAASALTEAASLQQQENLRLQMSSFAKSICSSCVGPEFRSQNLIRQLTEVSYRSSRGPNGSSLCRDLRSCPHPHRHRTKYNTGKSLKNTNEATETQLDHHLPGFIWRRECRFLFWNPVFQVSHPELVQRF